MIPLFPKFIKLNLHHKNNINRYTSKFLPYCDYNFVSLWCYNIKNEIDLSILNNNLVIKFTDYLTSKNFYSFFGDKQFEETSLILLKHCKKKNFEPKLKLIPEIFIKSKYKKIDIIEDRHNFDYIYSLEVLSKLAGKKFLTKRKLLNKFNRIYPQHDSKKLNLINENVKKSILKLFFEWESVKNKVRKDTKNELLALTKLLKHSEYFKLLTLGIYVDQKLIGFTITEKVHHNYVLGHFAKTNHVYQGINEALYKYTADYLLKEKCKYLNMEQDMGLENLRYSKSLWQPKFFLKKYTIELKKT